MEDRVSEKKKIIEKLDKANKPDVKVDSIPDSESNHTEEGQGYSFMNDELADFIYEEPDSEEGEEEMDEMTEEKVKEKEEQKK